MTVFIIIVPAWTQRHALPAWTISVLLARTLSSRGHGYGDSGCAGSMDVSIVRAWMRRRCFAGHVIIVPAWMSIDVFIVRAWLEKGRCVTRVLAATISCVYQQKRHARPRMFPKQCPCRRVHIAPDCCHCA